MSGEGLIGPNAGMVKSLQAAGLQVRYGVHTTIDEDDTIATGLSDVLGAVCTLESDPVLTCDRATVVVGTGGNIQIKTWMPTTSGDTTPIAATAFTKLVRWIAFGT